MTSDLQPPFSGMQPKFIEGCQHPVWYFHQKDVGHPWDGRPGFELLHLDAKEQTALDKAVKLAEEKHWHPWLIGFNEQTNEPGGVMYRPVNCASPWHDSFDKPYS